MPYERSRDLTNATVIAALTDFVVTTISSIPIPEDMERPLIPGISAEGWGKGAVFMVEAIRLGGRINERHREMVFQKLVKKFELEPLPSDQLNTAVTQRIEEMLLGIVKGDQDAMELAVWMKENSEEMLLTTLEELLPGPIKVTFENGLPVHVRRVEG